MYFKKHCLGKLFRPEDSMYDELYYMQVT